jgi:hypothetical protein
MHVKSVQKNLLLEGVSNRNETRRFRLRLISQEMSREIWYARRKKTSRYGHSHEKYFFATDANLVLVSICDFRSVPLRTSRATSQWLVSFSGARRNASISVGGIVISLCVV